MIGDLDEFNEDDIAHDPVVNLVEGNTKNYIVSVITAAMDDHVDVNEFTVEFANVRDDEIVYDDDDDDDDGDEVEKC